MSDQALISAYIWAASVIVVLAVVVVLGVALACAGPLRRAFFRIRHAIARAVHRAVRKAATWA